MHDFSTQKIKEQLKLEISYIVQLFLKRTVNLPFEYVNLLDNLRALLELTVFSNHTSVIVRIENAQIRYDLYIAYAAVTNPHHWLKQAT